MTLMHATLAASLTLAIGCAQPPAEHHDSPELTQLHQDIKLFSVEELPAMLASYPNRAQIQSEIQADRARRNIAPPQLPPGSTDARSLCTILLQNMIDAIDAGDNDSLNDNIDFYLYFCA